MELVPYYGNQPLVASSVTIQASAKDQERALDLVMATSAITAVNDPEGFSAAKRAAGALKSMLSEIEHSRKGAGQPFDQVVTAIRELARDIAGPVNEEYSRITSLMSVYVQKIEEQRRAEEAKRKEALRESERVIAEARKAQAKAQSEAEEAKAQLVIARAELDRAAMVEAAKLAETPLVPGGRVMHRWQFKLVDIHALMRSGKLQLIRFELDILACNDAVKLQLAEHPGKTPALPGIEITRETSVSVRPTVRTI